MSPELREDVEAWIGHDMWCDQTARKPMEALYHSGNVCSLYNLQT